MNGVSQKAHFIMESVMTASLQAQLNANIAPGVVVVVLDNDVVLFVMDVLLLRDAELL